MASVVACVVQCLIENCLFIAVYRCVRFDKNCIFFLICDREGDLDVLGIFTVKIKTLYLVRLVEQILLATSLYGTKVMTCQLFKIR